LSGKGGLVASGRWHTHPRLVIYTSESLALANLELLVHLKAHLLPKNLVAIELDVPDAVQVVELGIDKLPKAWRRWPAPRTTQNIGNAWLDDQSSALLKVPSAIIPTEFNFLINPLHPDCERITVTSKVNFTIDARLISIRQGKGQPKN